MRNSVWRFGDGRRRNMLEMVKELWDVTFVMDKGHILCTYAKEALASVTSAP